MTINFGEPLVKKTTEVGIEGPFGTHDTLRHGFRSTAHALAPRHPLQRTLATIEQVEEARKLHIATTTLGQHMALRLSLDKSIVTANGTLGGLKSKRLTSHIIAGTDEDIDVSDIFNVNPTIRSMALKQPHDFINI